MTSSRKRKEGARAETTSRAPATPPETAGHGGELSQLAVAVFGAALFVRVLYLVSVRHAVFFTHLMTEPERYDGWANAILRGEVPFRPPFDEAPGYPYFVAGIYALFGHHPFAVGVAQAVLDAASAAALAIVARRLGGPVAGYAAGAIATLFAPLVYFTGQIEPATIAVFAVSMALLATPMERGASDRKWLVAGAAWGAGLLVRSELALAIPVVAAAAALADGKRAAIRAAAVPLSLLAASVVMNVTSSGYFVVLTTGSGANLWLGNNAYADGVNPFLHGPLEMVAARVRDRAHDAVQVDALFREEAFAYVRAHPFEVLRLAAKKLAWTFTARELPNAADVEWSTKKSWLFAAAPVVPLSFGLVFPLAAAGATTLRRKREAAALAAPIVVGVVTCVVFFTNARFRLVLAPALVVLAALAVARTPSLVPFAEHRREALRLGAATAVAACVAWLDVAGVRSYEVPEIAANTATLEMEAGEGAFAAARLSRLTLVRPEDPTVWLQLASVLERQNRVDEARRTWRDARGRFPENAVIAREAERFAARHDRSGAAP